MFNQPLVRSRQAEGPATRSAGGLRRRLRPAVALCALLVGLRADAHGADDPLPSVKASVEQSVNSAAASGELIGYSLVTFAGEDVSEPLSTYDASEFLERLSAIASKAGGTCRRATLTATLRALQGLVSGAPLVVYAGGDAADAALAHALTARAADRDTSVLFLVTGACSPSRIDPVYTAIARETGGQAFFVAPSELPALSSLPALRVSDEWQPLLLANGVLAGSPRVVSVPVDLSVRDVVFSVSASNAVTVSVHRPDGTLISPGAPGATMHRLSTGGIVAVQAPAAGEWRLAIEGIGEYSVAVHATTPLRIERFSFVDHQQAVHSGFFEIQGQPIGARPAVARGRVEGTSAPVTFEAVSLEGSTIAALGLETGHPDAVEEDHVGTFTLPNEPFRVVVRGIDGGRPFQRFVPRVFRPRNVRVLAAAGSFVEIDGESVVTFLVWNAGPAATFDIVATDDREWLSDVSPRMVTLEPDAIARVEVRIQPPPDTPDVAATQLTLTAAAQGQPDSANSAFVDLHFTRAREADRPAEP